MTVSIRPCNGRGKARTVDNGVLSVRRYSGGDFMGLGEDRERPVCGSNALALTASALHKTHEHKKGNSRVFAVSLTSVS